MAINISRFIARATPIIFNLLLFLYIYYLSAIDMKNTLALQDIEIDICAHVYRVIDGDTLDAFPVGRIRFADIDTPELNTPEGEQAKQALSNLITMYGSRVYLDIDDFYVIDKYNRLVAVVYLRYNETHILNINKWLINNGYASIIDYSNEFEPYTWALYLHLPYEPCTERTMIKTITKTIEISTTSITTYTTTKTIIMNQSIIIKTTETTTYVIIKTKMLSTAYTTYATLTSIATATITNAETATIPQIVMGLILIVLIVIIFMLRYMKKLS